MKKNIISVLLSAAMISVLAAGCGGNTGQESQKETDTQESSNNESESSGSENNAGEANNTEKGKYRLLLSNAYYTAPYCAPYNEAALAKAEELGCTLDILDGNGNQQTQLEHANLAIAEKYDGFLYFPADVEGAVPVIEALNEGGIAWCGVNAYTGEKIDEVGMAYYVGPDVTSHGETIANTMKELFPDGCSYVTIAGTAGHSQTVAIDTEIGKLDTGKYVNVDYQNADFAAETAMSKMADMLTAYGLSSQGGRIDCIVVEDGGMTTGVISALESSGCQPGDVKIIACGSNQVLYDAMANGWLSATSTQDPYSEGALAVQTLYDILEGKAEKGWIKLPTPVAYPETADEFNWF